MNNARSSDDTSELIQPTITGGDSLTMNTEAFPSLGLGIKNDSNVAAKSGIRGERRGNHENNLTLIRLLLAVLVVLAHSYPLTGATGPFPFLMELSRIAVDCFFLISGYLITQSWLGSRSGTHFLIKRIARIYPGYIVAFLFSALIGMLSAGNDAFRYLKPLLPVNDGSLRSLLFLDYGYLDSPFAFPLNPFPHAVNGSLWTLQPELLCYLLVMAIGAFNGFANRRRILVLSVACIGSMLLNQALHRDTIHCFWRFLSLFGTGATFFLYRDRLPLSRVPLIITAVVSLASTLLIPLLSPLVFPIAGGYLLFSVGLAPRLNILTQLRDMDLSYGVYIYAFPIQQVCVLLFGIREAFLLFVVALPIISAFAWLSWHFVERPMLTRFGSRKMQPAGGFPMSDVATPVAS